MFEFSKIYLKVQKEQQNISTHKRKPVVELIPTHVPRLLSVTLLIFPTE